MSFEFWMLAQLGRELSLILYFNSGFSEIHILLLYIGCRPFESATPSQSSSLPNPHFQILFLILESAFLGLSRILRFSQFSILLFDSAFCILVQLADSDHAISLAARFSQQILLQLFTPPISLENKTRLKIKRRFFY